MYFLALTLLIGFSGITLYAEEVSLDTNVPVQEESVLIDESSSVDEVAILEDRLRIEIGEVVSGTLSEESKVEYFKFTLEEAGRLYVCPGGYSGEEAPKYDINVDRGWGDLSKTCYYDLKAGTYSLDMRADYKNPDKNYGTYSFILEFESALEEAPVNKDIELGNLYYGQIDQQEDDHYNYYYFEMQEDGFVDIDLASWVPENEHGAEQHLPSLKYELEKWNRKRTDSISVFHRTADKQYHDRLLLKKGNYSVAVSATQGNFTLKVSLSGCIPEQIKTEKKQYLYPADKIIITNVTFSDGKTLKYCNELNYCGNDNAYQYEGVSWESDHPDVLKVDQEGIRELLQTGKTGTAKLTAYAANKLSVKTTCNIIICFDDVQIPSKYYFDPVYWAVGKGIASGSSTTNRFNVQNSCTRLQMVIMLWKLAGSPKVNASPANKFSDLTSNSGKTAIAWAVKRGIINGFADGTFRPKDPVTRKQTMIMLYRLAGKPAVKGTLKFKDCNYKTSSDAYKAILWGTKKKITNGVSATSFDPDGYCKRCQIVTFLYKYTK